jgi:hypothetical protein
MEQDYQGFRLPNRELIPHPHHPCTGSFVGTLHLIAGHNVRQHGRTSRQGHRATGQLPRQAFTVNTVESVPEVERRSEQGSLETSA